MREVLWGHQGTQRQFSIDHFLTLQPVFLYELNEIRPTRAWSSDDTSTVVLLYSRSTMADPVSILGSVVGVASLAIQVTQILHSYCNSVSEFHSDIQGLLTDIQQLSEVLGKLEGFLKGDSTKLSVRISGYKTVKYQLHEQSASTVGNVLPSLHPTFPARSQTLGACEPN